MTFDYDLEAFARRHAWPRAKARAEAERQIENAVEAALAGSMTAFDQLRELEGEARLRFADRLRAGEGAPGVSRYSGTTGARLP